MNFKPIKKTRPAYNPTNSIRFLPFFKKGLQSPGVDIFLPASAVGNLSTSTLQNRCAEALLWLTNNELEPEICEFKKEDFQRLRGMVKFYVGQVDGIDGVRMSFRRGLSKVIEDEKIMDLGVSNLGDTGEAPWKIKILEWLQSEDKEIPLILEGVKVLGQVLSEEDIKWVERTFITAEVEFTVDRSNIRAMK